MIRIVVRACILVLVFLAGVIGSLAHAADGELSTVYVPKKEVKQVMAPVELVFPSQDGPALPRALMWVLQQQLQEYMQPMMNGYNKVHEEKCTVQMRQLAAKLEENSPYFRAECWASPLFQGQSGEERHAAFEKPEEMVRFLLEFSQDRVEARRLLQKQLWHKQAARVGWLQ